MYCQYDSARYGIKGPNLFAFLFCRCILFCTIFLTCSQNNGDIWWWWLHHVAIPFGASWLWLQGELAHISNPALHTLNTPVAFSAVLGQCKQLLYVFPTIWKVCSRLQPFHIMCLMALPTEASRTHPIVMLFSQSSWSWKSSLSNRTNGSIIFWCCFRAKCLTHKQGSVSHTWEKKLWEI